MNNIQSDVIILLDSITNCFETIREWKNQFNNNIINVINTLADSLVNFNKLVNGMNPDKILADATESLSETLVTFIQTFNNKESEQKKLILADKLLQKYEVWGKALDSFLRASGMNQYAMKLISRKYPNRTGLSNKVEIGEFTYGTPLIHSWGVDSNLKIGKFCSIADQVSILLGGNHHIDRISTYPFNVFLLKHLHLDPGDGSKGDVIIGNDVWIGLGVTIMSGVKIGDGAVIGAKTVVSKDVPPYAVVVGNPGRVVKYRFDDETIEKLLKIKWWNWSPEQIDKAAKYLLTTNMSEFLDFCKSEGYLK